jgi:hypothetical protein
MKPDIFGLMALHFSNYNCLSFSGPFLFYTFVFHFSDASHFHTKKSLLYTYEGETITGLVGTSEVRSGLKLKAKCKITPVLPCVYMLQVNNPFVTKSD